MTDPGAFWEDLARDLADPAFARGTSPSPSSLPRSSRRLMQKPPRPTTRSWPTRHAE